MLQMIHSRIRVSVQVIVWLSALFGHVAHVGPVHLCISLKICDGLQCRYIIILMEWTLVKHISDFSAVVIFLGNIRTHYGI